MGIDSLAPTWKKVLWYLLLSVLALLVLFPVYMTIVRAISTPAAYVNAGQPMYPVGIQWDAFSHAFAVGDLGPKIIISAVVTFIIVVAQLITSVFAAYAFAFLDFWGKRIVFALFMATLMLPIEVTLIPNGQTIRNFGWLNSFQV